MIIRIQVWDAEELHAGDRDKIRGIYSEHRLTEPHLTDRHFGEYIAVFRCVRDLFGIGIHRKADLSAGDQRLHNTLDRYVPLNLLVLGIKGK